MDRQWIQCEVKLGPGAEPWLFVRHRRGMFRVPGSTTVLDMLEGLKCGWNEASFSRKGDGGSVTISREYYAELLRKSRQVDNR